jgi:hypothetical protein
MNKNILPTILGFGISLLGIYLIVRVSSKAWATGQKK